MRNDNKQDGGDAEIVSQFRSNAISRGVNYPDNQHQNCFLLFNADAVMFGPNLIVV